MDSFQQIVANLLFATDASRSLFQLSGGDDRFPIRAEAVRNGFQQIRHGKAPTDTVDREALTRGKALFVENEAEIPGLAGVKARMVAPLLDEEGLKGWISVHADAPRSWTSEARLALETARAEASALLAAPNRIGVAAEVIRRTLDGRLKVAPDGTVRTSARYLLVGRASAARPDPVQAAWLYAQMVRWGQAAVSPEAVKTAQAVFRPDLYDAALGLSGLADPGRFGSIGAFAGPAFDPNDIAGYLASFKVLRRVP